MEKIPTIFDRDWDGNRGVVDKPVVSIPKDAIATEKLDGTNVRVTIRNHIAVRLEKRCNPTKVQKHLGIKDPWYIDATDGDPQDKWIWEALRGTDLSEVPDGEWSAEALGENIQGNPLNLKGHVLFIFSYIFRMVEFINAPTNYEELKDWLPQQKSKYGNDSKIEGLVWWYEGKPIGKIKLKDFKQKK